MKSAWVRLTILASVTFVTACHDKSRSHSDGGTDAGIPACANPGVPFDVGSPNGHADPLNAPAGQARAGRIQAAQLPPTPSGLGTWEGGDFVLANDRVAMVIEDADDSDLYDPWGGKPVGLAHVRNGQLVDPSDFGEILIFAFGPSTVVTEHVGVVNDGSNGQAAVVRAEGRIEAIPFVLGLIGVYWVGNTFRDVATRFAIDYVLEPNSEHVDIVLRARHARSDDVLFSDGPEAHGFMYSDRLRAFQQDGEGFSTDVIADRDWMAFVDERGVGYAFEVPGVVMQPLPSASGFMGARNEGHIYPPCDQIDNDTHIWGRVHIGGPDADALLDVLARSRGDATRAISGHVATSSGGDAADVQVHVVRASDHSKYVTRARTDANGDFTVHVPATMDVDVYAYVLGTTRVGPVNVPVASSTAMLALPQPAILHVTAAVDDATSEPIPYKLQIIPSGASTIPGPLYSNWGVDLPTSGRLVVEYAVAGKSFDLEIPPGDWKVVASRGFRYEIDELTFNATAGNTTNFAPRLERSVDTPNTFCADFHIHSRRSNDSADETEYKLRSAISEDLDIPVRSEHEYAQEWDSLLRNPVAQGGLNSGAFAIGVTSVELTTMEYYGHFGVVPVEDDPTLPNGGTPRWQDFAMSDDYNRALHTLSPTELFARVHARQESPFLIVNHPMGGGNYFGWTEYDGVTGTVGRPERWSDDFDGIEVFNSADWLGARNGTVRAWLSFLDRGVHMVAVGSSDSHSSSGSPVGYDRTCLDFGPAGVTSIPQGLAAREAFGTTLRDVLFDGHAVVNGGVFVDASVTPPAGPVARPGDTASGLGSSANVHITVRAASWVDVDQIEIVVDGRTFDTIDIAMDCTQNGVIRCDLPAYPVPVAAANGYVVVAAYGNATMEPVMRGRIPFGATNAIYLER